MMQNGCESRIKTVCITPFGSLNSGRLLILSHLFNICAVPLTPLEFMKVYVHITDCMLQVSGQILPWEMTLQGGDILSAPEQLHMISYVCVSFVFVSVLVFCDHSSRKEAC